MLDESSMSISSFYVPTDDEVLDFAEVNDLDSNAVEIFLFERQEDSWQIRKQDGRVEGVRDWQKFLTAFCEKYEADRTCS